MIKFTEGRCPECGHIFFNYKSSQWNYGSPIRTCKKCGEQYADKRYHEIEIDGIERGSMSIVKGFAATLLGGFFIYRGIYLSKGYMLGTPEKAQLFMPTVIFIMGCFMVLFAIVDIIKILTGIKAKKLEQLRMESEERLLDYNYANILKSLGYHVPEKYLQGVIK